jgi:hypothetical protein
VPGTGQGSGELGISTNKNLHPTWNILVEEIEINSICNIDE